MLETHQRCDEGNPKNGIGADTLHLHSRMPVTIVLGGRKMERVRMLKIVVLALAAVVWGPRAVEASFLDDFNTPGLVTYTYSDSYGSGGSFTVSGGKLNITTGNDNTASVMTTDYVAFPVGETLSLDVPPDVDYGNPFMMCFQVCQNL